MSGEDIVAYALTLCNTGADKPFDEDFVTTVLRHTDTGKWFGLYMKVPYSKLGIKKEGETEVLNLKSPPEDSYILRELYKGIVPAYHMNKALWISVILDSDVPDELIRKLTDKSYELTARRLKA